MERIEIPPYDNITMKQLKETARNFRDTYNLNLHNFYNLCKRELYDLISNEITIYNTKQQQIQQQNQIVNNFENLPNFIEDSNEDVKIIRSKGIWNNTLTDYSVFCKSGEFDILIYLHNVTPQIIKLFKEELDRKNSITVQFTLLVQFAKFDSLENQISLYKKYLKSKTNKISTNDEAIISEAVTEMKNNIISQFINHSASANASNCRFDRVIKLDINSDKNNPLRGGTYVDLPDFIKKKKCCINVKNVKNNKFKCEKYENFRCFEYAIESVLNPVDKDAQRPSKYDISKYEQLKVSYPIEITKENIEKYENFSLSTYSINIYECVDGMIVQRYLSKKYKKVEGHVNILLYKTHFVGIKNMSALLKGQTSNKKIHMYYCEKCHSKFENQENLEKHIEICVHEKINIEMPNNFIRKYKSNGAELFHPYAITLDFECTLKKIDQPISDTTKYIHEHIPNSFSFQSIDGNELIRSENQESLMSKFNKLLIKLGKRYNEIRKINIPINWNNDEEFKKYSKAKNCYICGEEFTNLNYKVRDHDHLTGYFRGAACNSCNLNLKLPKFIPILIHNLKYDSKLFLKWILKLSENYSDINIVPKSKEDFVTFSKKVIVDQHKQEYDLSSCTKCKTNHKDKIIENCPTCNSKMIIQRKGTIINDIIEFRFIDTFKFINMSLDKAVNNLAEVNNCFCAKCKSKQEIINTNILPINENGILKLVGNCKNCDNHVFKPIDYSKFENILKEFKKEDLHLVLRKGIYPYEWVDSYDKFSKQLPINKEEWYSTLGDKHIKDSDLEFAKKVYNHFKCKNFGEYHNLYLKMDTILLKDVIDNFRKTSYENYRLDPVYYFSAPGLSNAASLKFTGQELGLLKDRDTYEIYEKGVRGGPSMVPHRHAIANNCYFYDEKSGKVIKLTKEKAMEKGIWNSKKHISFILYLDANNLYGWAMSQSLPVGEFKNYEKLSDYQKLKHINPVNITKDFILNLKDNEKYGYTFIVDLDIPIELHDKFKDYPLLPEHYIPNYNELSDYQKQLIEKKIGTKPKDSKLIQTLKHKQNYIIDYRMLKECLNQGIILKKVVNYIQFSQKAWLKPYIDKNTKLRQEAKNDFEKDFYKLMNNAVYGKQMENIRGRCSVKIVDSVKKFNKQNDYETRAIIDEEKGVVLLYKKQTKVILNKPVYGGFTILELSKLLMFRFYYNFLKKKYGENIKLLATDTDSLIVYIETEDVYEDMKENINYFDTSEFKIDWMPQLNKKVPGLFKDEYLGIPIREFVGLRSKMYSFKTDISEKKVCKGIKYCNIERMRFDMYKDCLLNDKVDTQTIHNIESQKLKLYTTQTQKVALSPYDDKRYLVDNINTLPYGYYKLNQLN
jgi:hypothetical protein